MKKFGFLVLVALMLSGIVGKAQITVVNNTGANVYLALGWYNANADTYNSQGYVVIQAGTSKVVWEKSGLRNIKYYFRAISKSTGNYWCGDQSGKFKIPNDLKVTNFAFSHESLVNDGNEEGYTYATFGSMQVQNLSYTLTLK